MKTRFFSICGFLTIALSCILMSCGGKGDSAIEEKINGTWTTSYSETEYDQYDSLMVPTTTLVNAKFDYNALTLKFVSTIDIFVNEAHLCTSTVKGEWYADKNTLTNIYDKNSINVTFYTDELSNSEKEEAKREFASEIDETAVFNIKSLGNEKMTLANDEGEFTYTKYN